MKLQAILLFSGIITAALTDTVSASQCTPLGHTDGKEHTVAAMINSYTHIELPENVLKGTKPIVGNSELWVSDHAGPHVYIKPTSALKPGAITSLSVVGESQKSYNFKIVRKESVDSTCFKLTEGTIFSGGERAALTRKDDTAGMELATLWREKYMTVKSEAAEDTQQAVLDALRRYRYQIYTRYEWKKSGRSSKGTRGFIGDNLVSDVYDDGRFTYIRVYNDNKGLLMVEAKLEGQTEIIEAKFDSLNKMYTISGIFPEFTLKYGKSKLKIYRADNATVGAY